MEFFKFRWPGKATEAEKPTRMSRAAREETIEIMRRRARHRLIGAAVLVLVGVVGFPLVFDTQPRPTAVDARIEIPDRDTVAPLEVPAVAATQPASKPAAAEPAPTPVPHAAAPVAAPQAPPVAPERVASAPVPAPAAKPVRNEAFVEARPQPAARKPEASPAAAPAVAHPTESDRARALLEGRSSKPDAAAPGDRFIVQVGAFSDEAKAREVRQKLERAGIKTYAQTVDTKEGKRTRVRVGPFAGRSEAEKAGAKIKDLGLPAAILTL